MAMAQTLSPSPAPHLYWWTTSWVVAQGLEAAGYAKVYTGAEPPTLEVEGALLFHPKGRARLEVTLESIAHVLSEGTPLWLVGTRAEGMASADRSLARVARVTGKRSGRHARLLSAQILPASARAAGSEIGLRDRMVETTVSVRGKSRVLCSIPGVFSHGALDDGTRLLLETVPALKAPILDVGSGCGVIGTWYAQPDGASPSPTSGPSVVLVDTDAWAVEATRATLERNTVEGIAVHGDLFPATGTFQTIVSNPPFHQGIQTDDGVRERLIAGAPARLAPGGSILLVCNRFLPVQDPLDEAFGGHEVLADDGRYRVLRATRSR